MLNIAGRRDLASQLRTEVLIIEDEPIIAMDLEAMVVDLGHIRAVRIARTRKEAVAAIADHAPGLVLADIQLADGSSGLDAVNDILAVRDVPVVFITAYPERLLTGELAGADVPDHEAVLEPDTVKAVISRALLFSTAAIAVPCSGGKPAQYRLRPAARNPDRISGPRW